MQRHQSLQRISPRLSKLKLEEPNGSPEKNKEKRVVSGRILSQTESLFWNIPESSSDSEAGEKIPENVSEEEPGDKRIRALIVGLVVLFMVQVGFQSLLVFCVEFSLDFLRRLAIVTFSSGYFFGTLTIIAVYYKSKLWTLASTLL